MPLASHAPVIPPAAAVRHPVRAAMPLLAAMVVASLLVATPAEAIKLWEREGKAPGDDVRGGRGQESRDGALGLLGAIASALGVTPSRRGAPPLAEFVTRGDHRRALAPFARRASHLPAAAGDAEHVARHLAYGNALASRGYPSEATAEYLAALDLQPELQPAWVNLGVVARRTGHFELAKTLLQHAIDLTPRDGLAWYQLGMTEQAMGDLEAADRAYLRALELDPSLWSPEVNPHVLLNERSAIALHARYINRVGDQAPLAGAATPPPYAPSHRGR